MKSKKPKKNLWLRNWETMKKTKYELGRNYEENGKELIQKTENFPFFNSFPVPSSYVSSL